MQKLRSTVVEGVFSQAKVFHRMARSKFRGFLKVETQFLLTATVLNLKKMVKMLNTEVVKFTIFNKISDVAQYVKSIFKNLVREVIVQVP